MGHIMNPVLYRLNVVYYWKSISFSNKNFYDYIVIANRQIYLFVKGYFKDYEFSHRWQIFCYNIIFIEFHKKIYFFIFFSSFRIHKSEIRKNFYEDTEIFYDDFFKNMFFNFLNFKRSYHLNLIKFFRYKRFINIRNNSYFELIQNSLQLKKNLLNYINFQKKKIVFKKKL